MHSPPPLIDKITVEDLLSDERLRALYIQAVGRKWWPNNHLAVLDFFMCAEKALHDDKHGTPENLFYYLIKGKKNHNITQAMEDAALRRMPADKRQELVWQAGGLRPKSRQLQKDFFGGKQNIGFLHSVMVQCFLPQKSLPVNIRRFVSTHRKASLVVEAGVVANPDNPNDFKKCVLPHGSHARLILAWINRYALMHKTREIDMGASLRVFMNKVGRPVGGYNGKKTMENVEAIGAAQFIFGEWGEEGTTTKYGRVAQGVSFWIERDPHPNQNILWNPSFTLTQDYYDLLLEHPVPIDIDHLAKLSKSPRSMDIYVWLSHRLPSIRRGNVVRITLAELWKIFGDDISTMKKFSQTFKRNLKAVAQVHSGFNVTVKDNLLLLQNSPSPVSARRALRV